MKECAAVIASIYPDSLAEELGLEPGDKIITINGQTMQDIIDYRFAFADEEIEMLIEHPDGEQEIIEFDKDYDEELGVEFENAVFDGIRRCHNKCWFCFIDQMPPHMRDTLAIKDDDYRMSFLYGNFVTMTNMTDEDFKRIERLNMSPLFVSVQTTNRELRAQMLHNKSAADIMEKLKRLQKIGIEIHTQIVLCPGINDGADLIQTIRDLAAMRPSVLSTAIVPVGLTKYREKCYPLKMFTKEQAASVIDMVEAMQQAYRKETGNSFVYLGDEFYFIAERPVPKAETYDGYAQLENGIGMTRNFIDEWKAAGKIDSTITNPLSLVLVCGKSAAVIIKSLVSKLDIPELKVEVIPVENLLLGEAITVTGLMTGNDIIAALQSAGKTFDGMILPSLALRSGEAVFLDDMTLTDFTAKINMPVKVVTSGDELKRTICHWNNQSDDISDDRQYTWQGNCAYSKNK